MPSHPFTDFEIQKKKYQNEPQFKSVSRNNLSKIKDGAYLTNLEECKSIGTHCFAVFVKNHTATYFDSIQVKHILK